MSDEWLAEKRKLKELLQRDLDGVTLKLRAQASVSSDPKCAELAREHRKIQEFMKLLEGTKNDTERND